MPYAFIKRTIDLLAAAVGLALAAPVMLLVAGLIRWRMGRPVLFRQVRPGFRGRPLTLWKFRTMRDAVGPDGRPLPDADRLTPLGRWLRRTSLDELPQLFNVLRGELSLVGPRPLLPQYLDRYTPEQARRHEVRPGITGWAQVHGRNAISWEEKFALDAWYVDHRSLWLDLKILLLTLGKVLRGEGVRHAGQVTMPEFLGTASPVANRKPPLVIWGTSGHARVVADVVRVAGQYEVAGFVDDAHPERYGTTFCGAPILGGREVLEGLRDCGAEHLLVAVGECATRLRLAELARDCGFKLATAVHPRAVVAADVQLGPGTVVAAGAVINSGARIAENVIINTAACVDHDCFLDDGVHVAPGARLAGEVHVGRGTQVSIGATVINGIRIGAAALVGAGAVVVGEIPDGVVAYGVPARVIRPGESANSDSIKERSSRHRRQLTVNLRNEAGDVMLKRQVSTRWERVRDPLDA